MLSYKSKNIEIRELVIILEYADMGIENVYISLFLSLSVSLSLSIYNIYIHTLHVYVHT